MKKFRPSMPLFSSDYYICSTAWASGRYKCEEQLLFNWFQGCNLLGEKKISKKGGDKYKEGNQTPLSSMALVSTNKYHPLPARDGEVFRKAVPGRGD